jgi:hemolysin activation/secretion protein
MANKESALMQDQTRCYSKEPVIHSWVLGTVSVFTVMLSTGSNPVLAQQLPGAGEQLQQIPSLPVPERSIPDIRIERSEAPPSPALPGVKFQVKSLHVTGETKFSEAELIAAIDFKPGGELDLADLRAMAAKISDYYVQRGYFVAQAYLPAQDVSDGAVTIAVIEGHYGKVELRNTSKLSDDVANDALDGVKSGDIVATAPLERSLLILSDLPAVEVKSTLVPGSSVGTSDLLVDVTPGQRVTGSLEADNAGNPYTGEYRVGGSVNFNEILGWGDVATIRALTSDFGSPEYLNYVRGSYQGQVQNATIGVAYSWLGYRLGKQFSVLDATGTANVVSLYGGYPLIRSRNDNLNFLLDLDAKSFQDRVGVPYSVVDRRALTLTPGVNGDHHDNFGGGGWVYYSVFGTFGDLDIQTPLARAADAATARSNGEYFKLGGQVARLQNLVGPLSLYAQIRGQLASKNLDISEKMELGGAYAVRAYPEGEGYGDEGYVATLEPRLQLPNFFEPLPGQMQLFGFAETGSVTLNAQPWVVGPNQRTLSAAGGGFTWVDANDFSLKVAYAHKLGDAVATSSSDYASGRVWIQLSKLF